ncbi:hypothetical protein BDN71DRAFT_1435158 [Pleurotus eryngii]|uniref:Uncharacterized protein n=1 Tax=Pleurotus eryngii TaxID=5323 RepID=A0A9P5ZKJ7_PLEER|nr:hypothetical protein BDN71DRAFT_1435158 [Pleurotus eryngii]
MSLYQTCVLLDVVKQTEENQHKGGLKTQQAFVRLWNEWVALAMGQGTICNNIVNEHSLLLFVKYSAERCKQTRCVWDEIKTHMDITLKCACSGLVQGKDTPDIVTNTFLEDVTDEQMAVVGDGFIQHCEFCFCIYGHVAWVMQTASGNWGDDLCALKLAELQPWTVWIAHCDPVCCLLGAFTLLMHFLYNVKDFTRHMEVDWSMNKSWHHVCVLLGPGTSNTPFSDQILYNLYVKAFDRANFVSHVKAHLPHHILGYKKEQMGIDLDDTAQLGWVHGETYFDTY